MGEGDSPLGIANGVFFLYKGLLNVITDTFKSMSDSSVTRGYEVHSVFSKGKDVNEDLINAQKQNPRKR